MKTKTVLTILSALLFVAVMKAQVSDPAKMPEAMAANKANPSVIPDSYKFSWKYTMEMQSDSGKTMTANYLLEKDAAYFGMNIAQGNTGNTMLMILDTKNKITVTAFNKGGKKVAMAHTMKDPAAMVGKKQSDKKFTYKSLPDKTILGYKCKGIEARNPDQTAVFYFTNDAPVNFDDMFKSQQGQKMPDMFKDYFKPGDKPLMMSVDMTDTVNKRTMHMKCVALEKTVFEFKKAEYRFM